MTTHTLRVELGDRSYPVIITEHSISLRPYVSGNEVCIVSDSTIAALYLASARSHFAGCNVICHEIPPGEASKSLESAARLYEFLIANRFPRTGTIVALGGGVVGDLSGFVAATWQRGVAYIQMPTTLLAQVDSSVGGKTGVNLPLAKNMVGAFHHPVAVIANTQSLRSLPERQFNAGIAEVIKYGLIHDVSLLGWLERNYKSIKSRGSAVMAELIARSCRIKAAIVALDEREAGVRAHLNFGHTFGHAIEAWGQYEGWLHGEAVAAGMMMAADLSAHTGGIDRADVARIRELLERFGLPISGPADMENEAYLKRMRVDKKVVSKKIRLILLQRLGSAFVCDSIDESLLLQVIADNRSRQPEASTREYDDC